MEMQNFRGTEISLNNLIAFWHLIIEKLYDNTSNSECLTMLWTASDSSFKSEAKCFGTVLENKTQE